MDNCFVDITLEFLSVAFHSILYHSNIYPKSVFESRRKYSTVVYQSIHPEVNKYIELCLKTIGECLKMKELSRVELALTDSEYKAIVKFVFDLDSNCNFDDTVDAYLVQCEQNMRSFCLTLSSKFHKLKKLPEDASFSVLIHANESAAVSLSVDPQFEEFPMIEVNKIEELTNVVPLGYFSVMNYNIATYIEL